MDKHEVMAAAIRAAARRNPGATAAELADEAIEILNEWRADAAHERESIEDTPRLESCDRWGTGEGRYHGVVA